MSIRDDEFNWRESLERMGQAAKDLISGLSGRADSEEGTASSGNLVTESRAVSGFTQIKFSGIGSLHITQGQTESLSITADEAMMRELTSEVVGDTLELGVNSRFLLPRRARITFNVTVRNLTGVHLTGAGAVFVTDIHTDALNANLSGAGDMTVSGGARTQSLKITGAGNYHAREFQTATTDVLITGAGAARISASEALNATITGAGSVTYYGTPQIMQRISGIGSVKPGR